MGLKWVSQDQVLQHGGDMELCSTEERKNQPSEIKSTEQYRSLSRLLSGINPTRSPLILHQM